MARCISPRCSLVAPHLTMANHVEVLAAAKHKSKREVEQLVARLRPQPDVPAVVRKLPTWPPKIDHETSLPVCVEEPVADRSAPPSWAVPLETWPRWIPEVKPLAPERFKVQFTVTRETRDKLRQAQDLLRHGIPDGDPAVIFDRALTLLLAELTKTKFAATDRPQRARTTASRSRHIPAVIKREVWHRDGGQCAFRGERGRCTETGLLEFHHVIPYARGGPTTTENLELRCRAHNVYEAEQQFGRGALSMWARESPGHYACGAAPLGPDRVEPRQSEYGRLSGDHD